MRVRLSNLKTLPILDGSNAISRISRSDESIEEAQKKLFSLEQELYDEGARNFLFIDVPPMGRSPACEPIPSLSRITNAEHGASVPNNSGLLTGQSYERWNEILRRNVKGFLSENEDATTMILSSWDFFNLVFKTPSEYGFGEGDIRKRYGPVWADNIHPTSRMHEHFAARVNEFLSGYPPGASSQLD